MTALHLPTAYFIAGILYLVMPVAVWLLVRKEPTKTTVLWCVGGVVFGTSLVLLGLRTHLPDWLTHGAANGLLFLGTAVRGMALRHELKRDIHLAWVLVASVLFVAVYEFFNSVVQDVGWRFIWGSGVTSAALIWVALLARQLQHRDQSVSAQWLSWVYMALGGALGLRALSVMVGLAEPGALSVDVLAVVLIFLGVLTSIVGNIGFLGMVFERTNRKVLMAATAQARQEEAARLGDQIAQLDRRRSVGEIAASLAHELSQPLTNIYLITDRLDMELKQRGDPSLDKYFVDINRNTQMAGDILGRIRSFIRAKDTSFERVDMGQVLNDVSALIHDLSSNESVDVRLSMPEKPVYVLGDSVQLSQIFLNIFRNAIQATQGQSERLMRIDLKREGNVAQITFIDNGPGLAPEVLPLASDAFFTTKPEGLGVGLSISQSIAKHHGGSLSIGNNPGGGARVDIQLPAID
jgi:two-component system C4-dicarboxylate transport sensor histidine kinase DctB